MPSRAVLLGLVSLLLVVVTAQQCTSDLKCQEGAYDCNLQRCNCTAGYTGINCGRCATDSVCNTALGETCVNTFEVIRGTQTIQCDVTDALIRTYFGGIIELTCTYSDIGAGKKGNCTGNAWTTSTGPPRLAACTFSDCESVWEDGNVTTVCQTSSCACDAGMCIPIADNAMKLVKTVTRIPCDPVTGGCTLIQAELPVTIGMTCKTGSCGYPPLPHSDLSPAAIIGISIGVIALVLLCCGLSVTVCLRRYFNFKISEDDVLPEPTKAPYQVLSFKDVGFVAQQDGVPKVALQSCSGYAKSGQVLAIMGPSGSGKTTLLDRLATRNLSVGQRSGTVLLDGAAISDSAFRQIVGYVVQDDLLIPTETVREHLMFTAELRLPSSVTRGDKIQRVEQVIRDLDLSHVADKRIGSVSRRGISGGERRRVSIANVMVNSPQILILDEPTSGLDSANAQRVMLCLKQLAERNNTMVILSIHQPRPSIFRCFDNLLLLHRSHVIYFGPASQAATRFKRVGELSVPSDYNPADYFLDVLCSNDAQDKRGLGRMRIYQERHEVVVAGNKSAASEASTKPSSGETTPSHSGAFPTNVVRQSIVLCARYALKLMREPLLFRGHVIMAILLGLFVGIVFYQLSNDLSGVQDRAGAFFFSLCLLTFGSLSVIDVVVSERPIFVHENTNGSYRTSAYMFARTIVDFIPMRIIPPIILALISYWMIGLRTDRAGNFLYYLLNLVLANLTAAALCIALACIFGSTGMATLAGVLCLLYHMLFGGFLINRDGLPPVASWLPYISLFNYAYEAMMINEFDNLHLVIIFSGFDPIPLNGNAILAEFALDKANYARNPIILAAMMVIYLIIAYVALRLRVRYAGARLPCCRGKPAEEEEARDNSDSVSLGSVPSGSGSASSS